MLVGVFVLFVLVVVAVVGVVVFVGVVCANQPARQEAGRAKNTKNELEKCVNGRAGRAPRCMRALLVNGLVASETREQHASE